MFISTIIVAAGRGERFGIGREKKQFCKLLDKPLYLWSVEKLLPVSDEIILVLPKSDLARIKQQSLKYISQTERIAKGNCEIKFISGGAERSDSVRAALKHISSKSEMVCIHDAVRPLINQRDISKCIDAASKFGSAICASPATDTIKTSTPTLSTEVCLRAETHRQSRGLLKFRGAEIFIDRTLDRKTIWLAQTPQVFKKEIILKAYKMSGKPAHMRTGGFVRPSARADGFIHPSDDAQLVEQLGYKVCIVPTSPTNIKITYPADVRLAKQLMNQ